ncbi:MAG: hypothetical protein ABI416_15570 [Ginsengibacter sp.]
MALRGAWFVVFFHWPAITALRQQLRVLWQYGGTAIVIEPKINIAPPITKWEPGDIAIDILHHTVYAVVAGIVFDAIG